jgi:hypothetical protein
MFTRHALLLSAIGGLALAPFASADIITQWNFNSVPADGNTATGSFVPSIGIGTRALFGGLTEQPFAAGSPTDPASAGNDNTAWRVQTNAPQGTESGQRGVEFAVSTAGFSAITITWDQRYSSTSSKYMQLFYSTTGEAPFTALPVYFSTLPGATGDNWVSAQTADLSAIPGVANNPSFKFRIAGVFAPSTSAYEAASALPSDVYGVGGNTQRYDMVTVSGTPTSSIGPAVAAPSATPAYICAAGGSFLLTATVSPGQLPTSTGLTVTANLSALGGSTVALHDDGLSGDATAADNLYSALITIPSSTTGAKTITLTAADLQGRSGTNTVQVTVADCSANSASRVVISQVYGGGSNAGPPISPLNADYVELFNRSAQTIDLTGWSVQYAGPVAFDGFNSIYDQVLLAGDIKPGQYILIRMKNAGNTGAPIPAADFSVAPNSGGMGNNGGRVALVRSAPLIGTNCNSPLVEDLVGYGAAALCFEGAGPTNTTENDSAAIRKLVVGGGAQDSDQNFNDFTVGTPNPHNKSTGGFLATYASTDVPSVCRNSTVRITASVVAATSPTSSALTVTADLSTIGGSTTATLFDDGTHGDQAPGDHTFTLDYSIPGSVTAGFRSILIHTADAQSRTDTTAVSLAVSTCTPSAAPVVISQFFGGGGNAGAPFNADFVELFNRSSAPVNLAGWALQYADATGAFPANKSIDLSASAVAPSALTIAPGQYRLIQVSIPGASGGALPSPDFIPPNPFGMDNQFGRLALTNTTTGIGSNCSASSIIDLVGYGISSICFEGLAPAATMDSTVVALRKLSGCQDTNESAMDFDVTAPIDLPRNSASPANPCATIPTGLCCRGATCLSGIADQAACTAAGPTLQPGATNKFVSAATCNATNSSTTPCCYANYNHNTTLEVQDIFDFLNDWFAGKKIAIPGGDGTTGTLAVQNIFDFLNAWFAGGC